MRPTALIAALTLAGCASVAENMPIYGDAYLTLPPEALAARVTVTSDPLDGYTIASSEKVRAKFYQVPGVNSEVFFRVIAGRPGETVVQVYWRTDANTWLYPQRVNFGSPLRSAEARTIGSDVTCGRASSCNHYEDAVADLTADDVRALLSGPDLTELRLKTQAGINVDRRIRRAELEAVLTAAGVLGQFTS